MTDTNATEERADMLANAIAAKLLGAVNAPEQEIYRVSREIAALTSQAAQPAEADGWVMVPRQLTVEMLNTYVEHVHEHPDDLWSAMLAATPKAPATDAGAACNEDGSTDFYRGALPDAITTLDVFLAAYANEPNAASVERGEGDDLLTWGHLRTILAALATPPAPNDDLRAALEENERMREAITPSGATKAAYHGEFHFETEAGVSDAGIEQYRKVYVPWDTVKQIMAAIRARAALKENRRG